MKQHIETLRQFARASINAANNSLECLARFGWESYDPATERNRLSYSEFKAKEAAILARRKTAEEALKWLDEIEARLAQPPVISPVPGLTIEVQKGDVWLYFATPHIGPTAAVGFNLDFAALGHVEEVRSGIRLWCENFKKEHGNGNP